MDFIEAGIFGLLHGVTEPLPLSSSGHLVLLLDFFAIPANYFLILESVLFLSSALAIMVYFRRTIWILVQALLRKLGRLPTNEKDIHQLQGLFFGSVVAVIGMCILDSVVQMFVFDQMLIVGVCMLLASLFLMYVEWKYYTSPNRSGFSPVVGLRMGCWQVLAIIPGLPRLGLLIAGGMLNGLSRKDAARISYLLSIPVLIALGIKRLVTFSASPEEIVWSTIFVAAGVSFFVAFASVTIFMRLIVRYSLWPFIWYSLLLTVFIGYTAIFL